MNNNTQRYKEVAHYFRLKPNQTAQIIQDIIAAVKTWRSGTNAISFVFGYPWGHLPFSLKTQ